MKLIVQPDAGVVPVVSAIRQAKKTLDNSTFEYAYELYGDYLGLFPTRKEAYEIRFFYAELLYRLERFEQAGEQYLKVETEEPERENRRVAVRRITPLVAPAAPVAQAE